MNHLTVLICTHNRADLLERTLASLNAAKRPETPVQILVVANACTDDTVARMHRYQRQQEEQGWLPLSVIEVPTPGKSHALNVAIPYVRQSDIVTFVDDDHRVDPGYLEQICVAANAYPEHSLFCGRILPDWDGSEPAWVHDEGPYKIRPLPIPRSDNGPVAKEITSADSTPGGGNLFLRGTVFDRVGGFSAELGPRGHDLGGGEDSAFVQTALELGERLMYIPDVLQYHYVDPERLRFSYVLRKAYHRNRSLAAAKATGGRSVPLYMWRKLGEYALGTLSLKPACVRYYLVRIATTLGEISAQRKTGRQASPRAPERRRTGSHLAVMGALLAGGITVGALYHSTETLLALLAVLAVSSVFTLLLGAKSIADFTRTGPRLRGEVLQHYRFYSLLAFLRLLAYAFVILCVLATPGVLLFGLGSCLAGHAPDFGMSFLAGGVSTLLIIILQFSRQLLHLPASIAASYNYRLSRLYPYWQYLGPARLRWATLLGLTLPTLFVLAGILGLLVSRDYALAAILGCGLSFYAALLLWLRDIEPTPVVRTHHPPQPNILMIGSDTLRSDRLDGSYPRPVAPYLRSLVERGVLFSHCYVPCARTAPSLLAMLTGLWPHRIGVRDNFVSDEETRLSVNTLPNILRHYGYYTAAVSDWCGADFGKFNLGFDHVDVPADQWNLKFLIRQGPKDLRLFLSLFARNRFGKSFLPEIYYLGGVPLTDELGRSSRRLINHLAAQERPFILNLFYSTTHGPFGSEYPYYTRYADPAYAGESKFVMARLTDPFEIIRRQGEPKTEFDLDQIINLYDGCVTRFDDEIRRIMTHLKCCGLAENTLVVIYSDHGMEFFEHDTWGQGNSAIGDVSSRIPLLIHDPRAAVTRTVKDPVRSIDLVPTLLDLADIPARRSLDGVSLAPYLRDPAARLELNVFNETGVWLTDLPGTPAGHLRYPNLLDLITVRDKKTGTISFKSEYAQQIVRAKDRMIRRGRWKLTYQPLANGYLLKLFDMETDPGCTRNVADLNLRVVTDLWEKLGAWITDDPFYQESPR